MPPGLVPRRRLTADQLQVVEAPREGNRLVVGPSGSGKTSVLLHRARHLLDEAGLHPLEGYCPAGFRILVYTNALRDALRSAAPLLRIPPECVVTWDHWCRLFHEREIGPVPARGELPDFSEIRKAVRRAVLWDRGRHRQLLCALVDEGQDLPEEVYEVLRVVARHVTVFFDGGVRLFTVGSGVAAIRRALEIPEERVAALAPLRTGTLLERLAERFLGRHPGGGRPPAAALRPRGSAETPLFFQARSRADEISRVAALARERLLQGETVAILVPRRDQVPAIAAALLAAGLDLADGNPAVLTYHAAKGLSFDSVFLPRLVPYSFRGYRGDSVRQLLASGIGCARRWACLSAIDGFAQPLVERACEDVPPDELTVQRVPECGTPFLPGLGAAGPAPTPAPVPSTRPAPPDSLTDWL